MASIPGVFRGNDEDLGRVRDHLKRVSTQDSFLSPCRLKRKMQKNGSGIGIALSGELQSNVPGWETEFSENPQSTP